MEIDHGREDGGRTVSLAISATEAAALGPDVDITFAQMELILRTLVALRTGTLDSTAAYWALNDLAKLTRGLDGIRDAVVRQWPGSHGELALALDIPRSTAQSRRVALSQRPASGSEEWACTPATPAR